MLLAGHGKRFSDDGYALPKPLIDIGGVPMAVAAARRLPSADILIFVVSQGHVEKYQIDVVLRSYFPESKIVIQASGPKGQAYSLLEAEKFVNPESILTVASCDAGPEYNEGLLKAMLDDPTTDSLLWSFSGHPMQEIQPNSYSWIISGKGDSVRHVSYKSPVSTTPFFDSAVAGWFSYRNARSCFELIRAEITRNPDRSTEFSLDELANTQLDKGMSVKKFEVRAFISWGTPLELNEYLYWKKYFSLNSELQ